MMRRERRQLKELKMPELKKVDSEDSWGDDSRLESSSYTSSSFMVTSDCASLVTDACNRRRLSGGSGFGKPKSWGSVLYKKPFMSKYSDEYVVSFQGTELDDPEMFGFIIAQEPVLLTYESETGSGTVFPSSTAWKKQIVIQEGYALYMTQVIPCIDKMVAQLDSLGIVPSFITGHSLGGATATAYAEFLSEGSSIMGTTTFLVTFGAPPTQFADYHKGYAA